MQPHLWQSQGRLVSEILAGSWRSSQPPAFDFSESQLDDVTPLLYGSGGAALGWWRVRQTELSTTSSATLLHQGYRLLALHSAIHEEAIQKVFRLFSSAGIEAILIKGWAAAGLYPQRGLRPYGDIDLIVRPQDYDKAQAILARPEAKDCWVDLHQEVFELADRPLDQLFARSYTVKLGEQSVRLLGAEDHLALLAVHLLKHGAWRPSSLCDIGAAVESLDPNFDWELCLGHNRRRASWIICVIGLAHLLLGARIETLAIAKQAMTLPDWLIRAVLRQWQHPFANDHEGAGRGKFTDWVLRTRQHLYPSDQTTKSTVPNAGFLKGFGELWQQLRVRWPDPIRATIQLNGRFNRMPRLPYQLVICVGQFSHFLKRLPQEVLRARLPGS